MDFVADNETGTRKEAGMLLYRGLDVIVGQQL